MADLPLEYLPLPVFFFLSQSSAALFMPNSAIYNDPCRNSMPPSWLWLRAAWDVSCAYGLSLPRIVICQSVKISPLHPPPLYFFSLPALLSLREEENQEPCSDTAKERN